MKQEYKDFLQKVFHEQYMQYYSHHYEITKETENTIHLLLDDDFLETQPIHDLVSNLMEWDLMITGLVIGIKSSDNYDDEYLCMNISEIPMGDPK